jgi:hypothetical protein
MLTFGRGRKRETYPETDTFMIRASTKIDDQSSKNKTGYEADLDNGEDEFGLRNVVNIISICYRDVGALTFTKPSHTKDVDGADEDTDNGGVNRLMVELDEWSRLSTPVLVKETEENRHWGPRKSIQYPQP